MTAPRRFKDFAEKDPYPFYDSIREKAPVSWDTSVKAWLVADYETCSFVLRREDLFNRADKVLSGGKEVRGNTRDLAILDGEDHDRLHAFLLQLTARRTSPSFRESIVRPMADRLIDRFVQRGRADLAAEFADQLPARVGLALVGLDVQDEALVERVRWLKSEIDLWLETKGDVPEYTERAVRAGAELKNIIMPVVRERRTDPRDDLISELWRRGPSVFQDWSEEDIYAACRPYVGGGETLYTLRNLIYLLITSKELRERLTADPALLVPRFVEESLRVVGVLHWQVRIATEDVQLGGIIVKKGDRVFPMYAAANRDPHRFAQPAALDLDQEAQRNHLAFGLGPRYCTGSSLARAIILEATLVLLTRLRNLRRDEMAEPPHFGGFHVRSFKPLFACFES